MRKKMYNKFIRFVINNIIEENYKYDISSILIFVVIFLFPICFIIGKIISLFKIPFLTILGAFLIIFPLILVLLLIGNSSRIDAKKIEIEKSFRDLFDRFLIYHYNPNNFENYNEYITVFSLMRYSRFEDFMKCIRKSNKDFFCKEDILKFNFLDSSFTYSVKYRRLKADLDSFFGMLRKKNAYSNNNRKNSYNYDERTKTYKNFVKNSKYKESLRYFNLDEKNLSKDSLKSAYRKKAKEVHPDSKTGSEEEFKKALEFYNYLNSVL